MKTAYASMMMIVLLAGLNAAADTKTSECPLRLAGNAQRASREAVVKLAQNLTGPASASSSPADQAPTTSHK